MNYLDFLREMLGDPFRDLTDGELHGQLSEASGPCAAVLGEILERMMGGGAAPCLPVFGSDGGAGGAKTGPIVNTFPFGEKTHTVSPDYVGAALDNTPLAKVLANAERHCRDMERCLRGTEDRTVVILTDKWDQPRFRRDYEKLFFRYAMRDHVLFLFLLKTDHGVSRIPFLPWDRRALKRLADAYWNMGGSEEQAPLDHLLKSPVHYQIAVHSQGKRIHTSYAFDFEERTYTRYTEWVLYPHSHQGPEDTPRHDEIKSGKITIPAMMEFADAVFELNKLPETNYQEDPPYAEGNRERTASSLFLFDKVFRWGSGLGEFKKIQEAVTHLVGTLRLRPPQY